MARPSLGDCSMYIDHVAVGKTGPGLRMTRFIEGDPAISQPGDCLRGSVFKDHRDGYLLCLAGEMVKRRGLINFKNLLKLRKGRWVVSRQTDIAVGAGDNLQMRHDEIIWCRKGLETCHPDDYPQP